MGHSRELGTQIVFFTAMKEVGISVDLTIQVTCEEHLRFTCLNQLLVAQVRQAFPITKRVDSDVVGELIDAGARSLEPAISFFLIVLTCRGIILLSDLASGLNNVVVALSTEDLTEETNRFVRLSSSQLFD